MQEDNKITAEQNGETLRAGNRDANKPQTVDISTLFVEPNVPQTVTISPPNPTTEIQSTSTTSASTVSAPVRKRTASYASTTTTATTKSGNKKSSTLHIPAVEPNEMYPDRIRLGICAMDKKARSKPMAEILSRLDETLFHVIFFGDDMILNKPIEEWPQCEALIAFYSKGYPLHKAKEYAELRNPLILNDLEMQEVLKDRRKVYDLLEASGIDVPRHVFVSLDDYVSTGTGDGNGARDKEVVEFDDHIEVNGVSIDKPFVEKPVDADDHNIAIYYPSAAGGGCKKLFRKIGNRSSEFYPDINEVRRDGSYIYETFVETQGTDVKMYTVGPEYGHAEARKSPTVDGKVERNKDGKEIRFPVILTLSEKEIARRIVLQFKQFICGFDLLRVQEGHSVVSYVCDVNGFSFVKNSRKYYDDCAQVLTEHVVATVRPQENIRFSTLDPLVTISDTVRDDASLSGLLKRFIRSDTDQSPVRSDDSIGPMSVASTNAATTLEQGAKPVRELPGDLVSEPANLVQSSNNSVESTKESNIKRNVSTNVFCQEELRCVIAVVRHGDRTPKQKLKVKMKEPHILKYFHDHCESPTKDLKVKAKIPMIEFLETVRTILTTMDEETKAKEKKLVNQLKHMKDVLERWKFTGLNRKLQIKPKKWEEDEATGLNTCTEVQLVLKWGGNLTKLGENQAIRLGQTFRQDMYPDAPGGGILRLHSTFRHDLKIKTSDEGRVMKTAAAFAKGLLELEGEIPPILVSLVHKEKGSMHMLDPSGDKDCKLELDECKEKITANLQRDIDFREMTEEDRERMVGPTELTSMHDALAEIGNPRRTLMEIHRTMGSLIEQLEEMLDVMGSGDELKNEDGEGLKGLTEDEAALSGVKLYKGETLLELTERWRFIYNRLYDDTEDKFDLSRIPDVHDNVRFDVLHNPHLGLSSTLEKLYELAKSMADCVVPQEYGTTASEKRSVGIKICGPLLEKIRFDLNIARTDNKADMRYMINMDYSNDLPINTMGRRIRTRLYFTSESHLHTLLNCLRFAGKTKDDSILGGSDNDESIFSENGRYHINNTPELCYLTQVVFRLFENTSLPMEDPKRFRVEILFSPGATAPPAHLHESTRNADTTRLDTARLHHVEREGLTCKEIESFFDGIISEYNKDQEDKLDHLSVTTPPRIIEKASSLADKITDEGKTIPEGEEEVELSDEVKEPTKLSAKVINSSIQKSIPQTKDVLSAESKTSDTPEDPMKGTIDVAYRNFWGAVAVGSLLLGASCLIMALSLAGDSGNRRRFTKRGGF